MPLINKSTNSFILDTSKSKSSRYNKHFLQAMSTLDSNKSEQPIKKTTVRHLSKWGNGTRQWIHNSFDVRVMGEIQQTHTEKQKKERLIYKMCCCFKCCLEQEDQNTVDIDKPTNPLEGQT